jgi:hypothetical protein
MGMKFYKEYIALSICLKLFSNLILKRYNKLGEIIFLLDFFLTKHLFIHIYIYL